MDFHEEDDDIIRSSCSQMFFEIGVPKKFAIFTGKYLCWSLFLIKLQGKKNSSSIVITDVKGRIHYEIFLSRYFMKYSFRVIS